MDAAFGEGALIGSGDTRSHIISCHALGRSRVQDQSYSVALFLMTDKAQASLAKGVWELDSGMTIAIIDLALPKPATMPKADVYAFVFGQRSVAAVVLVQSATILPDR